MNNTSVKPGDKIRPCTNGRKVAGMQGRAFVSNQKYVVHTVYPDGSLAIQAIGESKGFVVGWIRSWVRAS